MDRYYLLNFSAIMCIICLLMCVLNFIIWMFNKYIIPVRYYLTDITTYSMADLKKPHAILYRQILIKNLYVMRKILKYAIIIVAISIGFCLGFIVFKNSDYFKTYFALKQQKLELATEAKVTEMLQTIEFQKQYTDSIVTVRSAKIDSLVNIVTNLSVENAKLLERNKNLNFMITNLNKIISTHGMDQKK